MSPHLASHRHARMAASALCCIWGFWKQMASNAVRLSGVYSAGAVAPNDVFACRDGLKMSRIYARTNTAEMVNVHPFWDGTVMQFIRKTMGVEMLGAFPAGSQMSISTHHFGGSPQPARLGLLYLFPKAVNDGPFSFRAPKGTATLRGTPTLSQFWACHREGRPAAYASANARKLEHIQGILLLKVVMCG